jgi:hypothetical protein
MTAAENLDFLAHQDWESRMKEVFKEVAPWFKILKKNILDYQKALEKAKKAAERDARKAATAAARAHGRARGTRAGRRGGRTGVRGRGTAVVGGAGAVADDSDSEPFEATESSESGSESDSESEAEIPVQRSRRQRPVRVIQERCDVAAVGVVEQAAVVEDEMDGCPEQPQPRPQPRSHIEGSSGAQDGGIEVPPTVHSSEIEIETGPQRRRNPRRGKHSDATNS